MMESTTSPFILHPNANFHDDPSSRFTSMSVTRNPGAVIIDRKPTFLTRVPSSLDVSDIQGARPKSLPPTARQEFFSTLDVEGAQPKQLHRLVRYTPDVVEGAWKTYIFALIFFHCYC